MKKVNHLIQLGKMGIKKYISDFQSENTVPNFVIEMILQDLIIEVKELRMCEMAAEHEIDISSANKDGD